MENSGLNGVEDDFDLKKIRAASRKLVQRAQAGENIVRLSSITGPAGSANFPASISISLGARLFASGIQEEAGR